MAHSFVTARTHLMTTSARHDPTLSALDDATRQLVRLAAVVAAGDEGTIRLALARSDNSVPHVWVEELILQSYLFSGFPRALNAMREWRRISARPVEWASAGDAPRDAANAGLWRRLGEQTCRQVYDGMYDRLRVNIRELHPELDEWMIVEGYGKVLSRPGLDLPRRELCIVAACAASRQERQLHSHLRGALNVGIRPDVVSAAIDTLESVIDETTVAATRLLWARVRGK